MVLSVDAATAAYVRAVPTAVCAAKEAGVTGVDELEDGEQVCDDDGGRAMGVGLVDGVDDEALRCRSRVHVIAKKTLATGSSSDTEERTRRRPGPHQALPALMARMPRQPQFETPVIARCGRPLTPQQRPMGIPVTADCSDLPAR